MPDPLPNKLLGDWSQAGYGDAYRAYQPYYYAQGVANGAYPGAPGAGVGPGGVDQSTTTIGTQIKVRATAGGGGGGGGGGRLYVATRKAAAGTRLSPAPPHGRAARVHARRVGGGRRRSRSRGDASMSSAAVRGLGARQDARAPAGQCMVT